MTRPREPLVGPDPPATHFQRPSLPGELPGLPAEELRRLAADAGFDDCRIAAAEDAPGFAKLVEWLEAGYGGSMEYIAARPPAYRHPEGVQPGCRSVVMLLTSYNHPAFRLSAPPPPGHGRVASYAASGVDYHDLLHTRMKSLIGVLRQRSPAACFRGVVDTAPLLERDYARLAGIGWVGKNTMLLSRRWGSFFLLSAVLTDLVLEPDSPFEADHCGSCTRCLDSCPTEAFAAPRVLDATRCISYLTIEHRGAAPAKLRAGIGDWVFGCDICQDVCPWNRKAEAAGSDALAPSPEFRELDLVELLRMDEQTFRERFRRSPMWRGKLVGMQRNALVVLGNQQAVGALPDILAFLAHETPLLRLSAAYALGRIGGPNAVAPLRDRLDVEPEDIVRRELSEAIGFAVGKTEGEID